MKAGDYLTVFLTLFAVIDILGSIPVIIDIRAKRGEIESAKATLFAGVLMMCFLFFGKAFLKMLGIDVGSFALAGSIVIFIIGLEMILGVNIFKAGTEDNKNHSIMPIAFPLIAGAGTLTTILSLKAEYSNTVIFVGILANLIVVYSVLKMTKLLEMKMGPSTLEIFRRIFGVILLAIAIKIFKANVNFVI
ncbi:MAG: MarC family protein [Chitinophagales bacterium]|nr:MarC family protein [Bacteroidota bacterium]MCB9256627.1 MarC family protein [Chitinophagales bacterium]